MEIIVADQIIMGLILNAGDAKQHVTKLYHMLRKVILHLLKAKLQKQMQHC